jgi:hypothetical protein
MKDHVLGGPVLVRLSVHPEPETEILRVGDLVGGDQPGAERVEGLAGLALVPLAAAFVLELPLGHVVGHGVPGHTGQRLLGAGQVARRTADDHRELDLPVRLRAAPGDQDWIVGADDGVRRLQEDHRFGGQWVTRLGGVVPVVQADTDDLSGT